MLKIGVWESVSQKDIEPERSLFGSKWVFKIKRNGIQRARLVALGYSQVPGVDFTDNFSPVINDTTLRIVLRRMLIEELDAKVIYVEIAFLFGDLDQKIYMKIPDGYNECNGHVDKDKALLLKKGICGLVQAPRQFWSTFTKAAEKIGFTVSSADPCLL